MQLIVTCAGCGAKYRGESGAKKFRCAACSNLFTFPDQPKAASIGSILCSNCWTEVVPTEKLKTCSFCSQRVSPRYGGLATEDKQVKVKQPSIRNDPNLVKAVTNPNQSGEMAVGGGAPPKQGAGQFESDDWKEIGTEQKSEGTDHKKTQAFEIMADLKKELEGEMQGMVESMMKSQDEAGEQAAENEQHHQDAEHEQEQQSEELQHQTEELLSQNESEVPAENAAVQSSTSGRGTAARSGAHPWSEVSAIGPRPSAADIQAHEELIAEERNAFQAKIADLEARLAQYEAQQSASNSDEAIRVLEAKNAELTSLLATDQRAKEQLIQDRVQLEELWRESDSRVNELTAQLQTHSASDSEASAGVEKLNEINRAHEAKNSDLQARLNAERKAREALERERDDLREAHDTLDAKVIDLNHRLVSMPAPAATEADSNGSFEESSQELEARIADLETRLTNEKKTKESLIRERDSLSDNHRELQARIADLESRLSSERSEKETISAKHSENLDARNELDAKVAHLESRLNSEREAKETAAKEREKLHEVRLELEARTADLTRRHSTEKEAKERVLKEHGELSSQQRELNAKLADFKTRLKSEQDSKENVRKERDEALVRADIAEARIDKSEADLARLRKGINAQLEKFAAEYNAILAKLAERTNDLAAHSATTREKLNDALLHHGDTIEVGAGELKSKLEQESVDISAKLKKLMKEFDGRDSARLGAQSGNYRPIASGSFPAESSSRMIKAVGSTSGTYPSSPQKIMASASEPVEPVEPVPEAEEITDADDALPIDRGNSSSVRAAVMADASGVEVPEKTASGTFWAKVFKRPQTKT